MRLDEKDTAAGQLGCPAASTDEARRSSGKERATRRPAGLRTGRRAVQEQGAVYRPGGAGHCAVPCTTVYTTRTLGTPGQHVLPGCFMLPR